MNLSPANPKPKISKTLCKKILISIALTTCFEPSQTWFGLKMISPEPTFAELTPSLQAVGPNTSTSLVESQIHSLHALCMAVLLLVELAEIFKKL